MEVPLDPMVEVGGDENRVVREGDVDGKRPKVPPMMLRDFILNTVRKMSSSLSHSSPSPSCSSGMLYPIESYVNCDRFSLGHIIFLQQ